MIALLIGATGATGKDLLELLIKDEETEHIHIFVRQQPLIKHPKLSIHCINFDTPQEWKHLVKGDVLFSCLGTTLKAAGSKEAQAKVDYNYQYQFAQTAKENNVENYVLVSSKYASPSSPFFYARIKGQLEEDVKKLAFNKLIIFNPPLLLRNGSDRIAEVIAAKVLKTINAIGLLKSNRPLPTKTLAKAMLNSYKKLTNGQYSIKGLEIEQISK